MASFWALIRRTARLVTPAAKLRPRPARRLGLEGLEERCMPVVGVNGFPATAYSGMGRDGVVQLEADLIGTDDIAVGSGTLLSTGRHILTAAHVLTNNKGIIDSDSVTVTFQVAGPESPVTMEVPRANYRINPGWTGNVDNGNDIAILILPEIAPFDAERFGIYRNTNEVGQIFQVVGYGGTNTALFTDPANPLIVKARSGAYGADGSSGVRRMGYNNFGGTQGNQFLLSDFDDGTAGHNTLKDPSWTGAAYEVSLAPGDSGGPAFIGNLIAGINSFTQDSSRDGIDSNFGDVNGFTRVSTFASWIDARTAEYGQRLVLDLNDQPWGNDGRADDIRVTVSSSTVSVSVNGTLVASLPVSQVTGLDLIGSGDNDSFTLTGLGLPANSANWYVTVNGKGGNDSLHIDDAGLGVGAYDARYAVTDGYVARNARRSAGGYVSFTAYYSGLEALTVDTASVAAIIEVQSTPYNVPVTVSSHSAGSAVTVGTAGRLTDIRGAVFLTNPPSYTAVTIDDSADPGFNVVTVDTVSVGGANYGRATFGSVPILFKYADTASLTLHTGTGGALVNVLGTGVSSALIGHGANTRVVIGNGGRLTDIRGGITVTNPPDYTDVTIDDSTDPDFYTVNVDTTAIGGANYGRVSFGGVPILFKYADTNRMTLHTGNHGATINVRATGVQTNFMGHGPFTTVNVGNAGRLTDILGGVQIENAISYTAVNVDNSADPIWRDAILDQVFLGRPGYGGLFGEIISFGGVPIRYKFADTSAVTLHTGTGGGTVSVLANAIPLTLVGHSANTSVYLGAGLTEDIGGRLTLVNALGFYQVNVDDADDGDGRFVVVDTQGFTGLMAGTIDWNQTFIQWLTITAGLGDDIIVVEGNPARVGLSIQGNVGNDLFIGNGHGATFEGGDGRDLLLAGNGPGVLRGGAGEDVLIGGTTPFDSDVLALLALRDLWAADLPYADRVDQLMASGLNRDTFLSNQGQNTLWGKDGLDLYYGSRARDTNDRLETEWFIDPEAGDAAPVQQGQQINAAGLGVEQFYFDGVWYDAAAPLNVNLQPGQFYVYVQGTVTYFTVNADGTLDYDDALEGALTGRGTRTLGVNGRSVTLDASALGVEMADIDGVWQDANAPLALQVMPGSHYVYAQGTVTYFTVNADGTLDYDEALEGALTGRGTTSLAVLGREVTIDATVLGAAGVNVDGVWYDPQAPLNLRLMSGTHYVYTADDGVLYFTVSADGTLDYDASLDGTLAGRGTQALLVLI